MLIVSQTETTTGMIPRAVEQVFRVADELKTKGWQYKMEGQFLEIVGFSLLRLWSRLLTDCMTVQRDD